MPPSDATPAGVAHLTGLCHELGEIVRLASSIRRSTRPPLCRAVQTGKGFPPAISDVLGIPYQEFMSLLLTKMGLPPVITVPIEEFFDRACPAPRPGSAACCPAVADGQRLCPRDHACRPVPDAPVTPISSAEYRNTFGSAGALARRGIAAVRRR